MELITMLKRCSGAESIRRTSWCIGNVRRRSATVNHRTTAGVAGAMMGLAGVTNAAAQTALQDRFFGDDDDFVDIASAGNGGVATASANGGAVSIGNLNSGGNVGSAIGVGDTVMIFEI
jgi:hypothetical protein